MKSKLVEKVKNEDHYKLEEISIDKIFENIMTYMVENNTMFNVPLTEIQKTFPHEEIRIFNRFLDENILLRKDLTPNNRGPFSRNEVVNFTYDSFRDYLISVYLLNKIEKKDYSEFQKLVQEYTAIGHQLREGLSPFLFVSARKSQNDRVIKFISTLDWYSDVFKNFIWDIDDILITRDDIELVNSILASKRPKYMAIRLVFWKHWNCELYPNLNIRILINYLTGLDDSKLEDFLERTWPKSLNKYYIKRKQKSERTLFIESIKQQLDNEEFTKCKDFHNVYELLLYLIPFSIRLKTI